MRGLALALIVRLALSSWIYDQEYGYLPQINEIEKNIQHCELEAVEGSYEQFRRIEYRIYSLAYHLGGIAIVGRGPRWV